MLYNKNNVRKTNDKKVLHKVGKQWKVVSVALLMALGGGAAVAATTNANANADTTATPSVQNEATSLENDHYTPAQSVSASSKASSASAKAPVLPNVQYAPSASVDGANASAASYNNQANFDQATMSFYGPTVKSYVNSINAKFPAQTKALQSTYDAASNAATNDAKSAKAYSEAYAKPENGSIVSELASKAGLTTSAFIDTVKYNASAFEDNVKAASAENYAMSLAYSLVNEASNSVDDLPLLSADAAVSDAEAGANYAVASNAQSGALKAYRDAVSASVSNATALTDARVASIEASGSADVALDNSGTDASIVNSFAQANSMVKSNNSWAVASNWNSSAVSSAVSAAANQFATTSGESSVAVQYSNFSGKYNFGDVSSAYQASNSAFLNSSANANEKFMYDVVSDTYVMSSAASVSASANKVIASAVAAKAGFASKVAATAASAKTNNIGLASLSDRADAAGYADYFYNVKLGTTSASVEHFASEVMTTLQGNNKKANLLNLLGANNNDAKLALYTLAKESGVDVNALEDNKSAIESVGSAIASDYHADAKNANDPLAKSSALSNAMSTVASNVTTDYTNASSASASYARSTDEDVTLAGYYASSYASDATSASSAASDAFKALNDFYVANADAKFASADAAYNTAMLAEPNDSTLAHAFGVFVLHNRPQFVTVTKNAMLHSAADYTAKNGVKSVKAGAQLAVKGVAFDEAGNIRYVVGGTADNPLYLTANDSYVENTYLEPEGQYTVQFNKSANKHKGLNFNSKVTGSVKAGQKVTGTVVATLANNTWNLYEGVARLQLSDGSYVTANQSYFTVLSSNNNNDNSESNKANNNYVRDLVLFK